MNARMLTIIALGLCLGSAACGRPFKVETAPGLYELADQKPQHEYRAMTPEGVVMAMKSIETEGKGNLDFWARTVELRMHQMNGYALLGQGDVTSRDGTAGRELRFGHDDNGKPYLYTVRLFVAQSRLFLVEVGGPTEQVTRYASSLDWMEASVKVTCSTSVSPVLASRTCNRW